MTNSCFLFPCIYAKCQRRYSIMCPTFALKVYYKTLDYKFAESAKYRHMIQPHFFKILDQAPFVPHLMMSWLLNCHLTIEKVTSSTSQIYFDFAFLLGLNLHAHLTFELYLKLVNLFGTSIFVLASVFALSLP